MTILTSKGQNLSKSYRLENGDLIKTPYQSAKYFTANEQEIKNIDDLSDILTELEQHKTSCVIRGALIGTVEPDAEYRRTKDVFASQQSCQWMCIDFDSIQTPPGLSVLDIDSNGAPLGVEYLISLLPVEFQSATYHYQWSSSAGVYGWGILSCHLWFYINKPVNDDQLKKWSDAMVKEYKIPVDSSLYNTVQVHYTATPSFMGMPDPLSGTKRSGKVIKVNDSVDLKLVERLSTNNIDTKEIVKIDNKDYIRHGYCLDSIIDSIGEDGTFYEKIRLAIAHYCAIYGSLSNIDFIKNKIRDKWSTICCGVHREHYMDDKTLDPLYYGAMDKFGRHTPTLTAVDLVRKLSGLHRKDFLTLLVDPCPINIETISGECGSGKTYYMLNKLITERGSWIYACDKITSINERVSELSDLISKRAGRYIKIYTIYSESEDGTASTSICAKLAEVKKDIETNKITDYVIFCSHVGLFILDFAYTGENLVIDEAYDVVGIMDRNYKTTKDQVEDFFELTDNGDDFYSVSPTAKCVQQYEDSSLLEGQYISYHMIYKFSAHNNASVYLAKDSWDGVGTSCKFIGVCTPYHLSDFDKIYIMGDEIEKSLIYHFWSEVYGVNFSRHIDFIPRSRAYPLADRATIYYFNDYRKSSKTYLTSPEHRPVELITNYLSTKYESKADMYDNIYYTTNTSATELASKNFDGLWISPKTHGRNDLQHYTDCAWLVAMRLSSTEATMISKIILLSHESQLGWREYNPLYQFCMRGCLRDYDSPSKANIYVVDKWQAEYLQSRLGCQIVKIDNIIPDELNRGGRPDKISKKTMSDEEKREYERERKRLYRQSKKMEKIKSTSETPHDNSTIDSNADSKNDIKARMDAYRKKVSRD